MFRDQYYIARPRKQLYFDNNVLFTNNADVDRIILFNIKNIDVLISACNVNKYSCSLCNDTFWNNKINEMIPSFAYPGEFKNKGKFLYYKFYELITKALFNHSLKMTHQSTPPKFNRAEVLHTAIADWATKNNYVELLKSMLKLNIMPLRAAFTLSVERGYTDILDALILHIRQHNSDEKYYIDYILTKSIKNNNIKMLTFLLQYGVKPDIDDIIANPNWFKQYRWTIDWCLENNILPSQDLINKIYFSAFNFEDFDSLDYLLSKNLFLDEKSFRICAQITSEDSIRYNDIKYFDWLISTNLYVTQININLIFVLIKGYIDNSIILDYMTNKNFYPDKNCCNEIIESLKDKNNDKYLNWLIDVKNLFNY